MSAQDDALAKKFLSSTFDRASRSELLLSFRPPLFFLSIGFTGNCIEDAMFDVIFFLVFLSQDNLQLLDQPFHICDLHLRGVFGISFFLYLFGLDYLVCMPAFA